MKFFCENVLQKKWLQDLYRSHFLLIDTLLLSSEIELQFYWVTIVASALEEHSFLCGWPQSVGLEKLGSNGRNLV